MQFFICTSKIIRYYQKSCNVLSASQSLYFTINNHAASCPHVKAYSLLSKIMQRPFLKSNIILYFQRWVFFLCSQVSECTEHEPCNSWRDHHFGSKTLISDRDASKRAKQIRILKPSFGGIRILEIFSLGFRISENCSVGVRLLTTLSWEIRTDNIRT